MAGIRAGGLASGLDTNSIIEQLVTLAKEPIVRYTNQQNLVKLEKAMYNNVSSGIASLKSSLFSLKMESTFKNTISTSSSESVLGVTSNTNAKVGSHNVEVLRLAKNSVMSSRFTTAVLSNAGAGIKGMAGLPGTYDQQEGTYTTNVATAGATWKATTLFEASNKREYQKFTGNTIDPSLADSNGVNSAYNTDNSIQFKAKMYGVDITMPAINLKAATNNLAPNDNINSLMQSIENNLNHQINAYMGTVNKQYFAVRADFDGTDWKTAIYNVGDENIEVSVVPNAGDLGDLLGLDTTLNYEKTREIKKYHIAGTSADLLTKMNQAGGGGVINGVTLTPETGGLRSGTLKIVQDASMSVKQPTKTNFVGGTQPTINTTVAGIGNSGLIGNIAGLAGNVTINGVTINIDNVATHSVNSLMALVNGSGAGVTMSYDSTEKKFKLEVNKEGAYRLDAGNKNDTSSFLSVFGFTDAAGAVKTTGNDAGSLITDNTLDKAGFTALPSSGIVTINGVPIYINNTKDTVQDVINKINKSGAGVTLSYDSIQDKFTMTSNSTDRIKFGSTTDTSTLLMVMGFTDIGNMTREQGDAGVKASLKVDGVLYERDTNNISDIITGVDMQIASLGSSTIKIVADTEKAVDALASFIKTYNEIINSLTPTEISKEDRANKMVPLTEEKRASMSSDEIATYQKEFDSLNMMDLLSKSRELKDFKKDLRASIMNVPLGNQSMIHNLQALGIDIYGAGDFTKSQFGFLLTNSTDIDDIKKQITGNEKIMSNLRTNSDEVFKFFNQYSEKVDPITRKATPTAVGWARNIDNILINYTDVEGKIGIKTRIDGPLEKKISRFQQYIDTQTERAEQYLERLWKQFSAMEQTVANIQSQGNAISQIASSGSSSK